MNGNSGRQKQVDKMAFVSDSAKIGENVFIGIFAAIGDGVEIGAESYIHPQVYLGKM